MASVTDACEFVVFSLAGQLYALPSSQVREVTSAVAIRQLPKAGDLVEGVFSYRGQLVPLLDIRRRFRLRAQQLDPAHHFIIADLPARRVAIRVDRVERLSEFSQNEISALHEAVPEAEYVTGIARLPDGLILIHDLSAFLSACEANALDASLNAAETGSGVCP